MNTGEVAVAGERPENYGVLPDEAGVDPRDVGKVLHRDGLSVFHGLVKWEKSRIRRGTILVTEQTGEGYVKVPEASKCGLYWRFILIREPTRPFVRWKIH